MNATTATASPVRGARRNGNEPAPPALRRQTMPAIVQDTYGGADVWRAEEIARPEIAGNEVLVKVHATGLDRAPWHLMAGEFTPVVDKTYPLHEAPGVMCYLEAGHAQGKLVITVTDAG